MRPATRSGGVITNREIRDEALLAEVLDEVVESARANGIGDERLAAVLRERAARIGTGETGEDGEESEE